MNLSQLVDPVEMGSVKAESEGAVPGSFTERDCSFQVGTPAQFRWLEGVVKAVVVMNLVDALMTLLWVTGGYATEANPFLEPIVNEHGFLFVMSKLALVFLGTTLLWRHRRRPLAVLGIFAAFLVYYWILLVHLSFASLLVGQLFAA